jgi:glycosyltransferase involved in cell wall biosynthesis
MARRTRLSACIITYNEERNLVAALESVSFADEIIVVDSHSTDQTRSVALAFAEQCKKEGKGPVLRLVERDWPGHIEQKNHAIQQATHDWVFCIDADERVSPELRQEVEEILSQETREAVGYTMPRKTHYLGKWIYRGGWYPDRKLRFFTTRSGSWSGTNPHDHVFVTGRVEHLHGALEHYSYRDMESSETGFPRRNGRVHCGGAGCFLCLPQVCQTVGTPYDGAC